MKYLVICSLLLITTLSVDAQTITIRDKVTGEALEQVALFSRQPRVSAVTDARGRVNITPFVSADSIRVEMIGYVRKIYSYQELVALGPALFLEQTPFAMNEVVVSATRWRQARSEVPARILSLSRTDLSLQQSQTTADALNASGEVFVQKSQLGGGSPMIRGFATNRVLLAVDGVRMNTAIFRSGNVHNVISLDQFMTERIEIVFGPGSVAYGSDAIGGVLSFSTLTPRVPSNGIAAVSGNTSVRYSSANDERTAHVDMQYGVGRWGFVTGATYSDFGDLRMGRHGPDEYLRPEYVSRIDGNDIAMKNADPHRQVPTEYNQLNLTQKIRFRPNDDLDINYGGHYSRTSDFSRYDRLLRYRNDKLRSAEWYYGPQVWMMHSLNMAYTNGTALFDNLNATVAYQRFEESRHDRDFGKVTVFHRYEAVDAVSVNLDMEKNFAQYDRLQYGFEFVHNTVGSRGEDEDISTGNTISGPSRYPDGSRWNSWAVHTNYRRILASDLSLQAGARYNVVALEGQFDTRYYPLPFSSMSLRHGSLNGSLGLVYSPDPTWQLGANISSGFRSPNIDDVGKVFDSTPGFVIVPNPDLRPEYAYNGEVTVSKIIAKRLKLQLTGYYTLLDDALVRRDFTLNGLDSMMYSGELSRVQAIQNAAWANVHGVQAYVEMRLPNGLALMTRFNYQKGEEELDDGSTAPLRHAPPWYGVTHFTWSASRIEIDLYAMYSSEVRHGDLAPDERAKAWLYAKDSNGNAYSPSWYTLNVKGRYRVSDMLVLHFGVENLTDRRYRPYSSGITAAGRNVITGLKLQL